MDFLPKIILDVYREYMKKGDPRVTNWPFMKGPTLTFTFVTMYLLFVKKIGPSIMENRKAFNLRIFMIIYNFGMVYINVYFLSDFFRILLKPTTRLFCILTEDAIDNFRIAELGWWFFMFKFVEFTDTVFFILRKKDNQVTRLHVIHHAIIPIGVWAGLRIQPGDYNYFFPALNTVVHIIMYTYYGLSALGPSMKRFLWWKKYLTILQIVQFVLVFCHIISLIFSSCEVSKFILFLNALFAGLFLPMFANYYNTSYKKIRSKIQ